MYTVLWSHSDGLNIETFATKEELLEAVKNGDFDGIVWHSELNDTYALLHYCNQGIIIKGEMVVPFEKKVVTEYDVK